MKVSVHIITYNDEKNICRAIESALSQNVNFDYEIVIGDDCSTDNTRELLKYFRRQYPNLIRLHLHESNFRDFGKTNFAKTLAACSGEYVALLPGDDYWTSPVKLQKQVDFLDANSEYSACFHNVLELDDSVPEHRQLVCPTDLRQVLTLEDLLETNWAATCSVVFRGAIFGGELPKWFYKALPGDWFRNLVLAQHGKIRYLSEVMAVYRKQPGGVWSTLRTDQQLGHVIDAYRIIGANLDFKYQYACLRHMRRLKRELSYIALGKFHTVARSGHFRQAVPWLITSIKHRPALFGRPLEIGYILKSCILASAQIAYGAYAKRQSNRFR